MSRTSSWVNAPREGWTAAQAQKAEALSKTKEGKKVGMGVTIGWSLPKRVKR